MTVKAWSIQIGKVVEQPEKLNDKAVNTYLYYPFFVSGQFIM